jgi:twitching motility two-component system response regulator PilH
MPKKILIIDDDTDYTEAVSATLSAKGYETISCVDGASGIEAARSSSPDLIILDVMMTYDSEGFDMAGKLAADSTTKSIPVILATGIRHPEDLPLIPGTVKATLEKPIRPDILLAAIEKALAG